MSLYWFTGFENNANADEVLFPTGSVSYSSSTKRTGNYSLRINPSSSNAYVYLGKQSTSAPVANNSISASSGCITVYLRIASAPGAFCDIINASFSALAISLWCNTNRTLQLRYYNAGWNNIGSASSALSLNTWYKIDMWVGNTTASGANNHAGFRVDGSTVASSTTIDTQEGNLTHWYLGNLNSSATSFDMFFDDFVSYSGETPITYNPQVLTFAPTGAGNYTDLSTGSYLDVDETPSDTTTTKVTSGAVGSGRASFTMADATGSIAGAKGIKVKGQCYTTTSYSAVPEATIFIRLSGTDYEGSGYSGVNPGSQEYFDQIWENSPATSSPFTLAELDAIDCGVRFRNGTSTGGTLNVSRVFLEILNDPDANTAPSFSSQPSVNYNSTFTRTGANNTPITISFTPSDPEQTGSNAISYQIRTASGGGGTLVGSGTCTSGASKNHSLAYNDTGISNGSNTLYVRLSDGITSTDSNSFVVLRDDTAPNNGTVISYG